MNLPPDHVPAWMDLIRPVPKGHPGFVYVVGFRYFVKIGWSRNVISRFYDVQKEAWEPLQIIWVFEGSRRLEHHLHDRFCPYRIWYLYFKSTEWFWHEGVLAEWIEKGCPL